MSLCNVLNQVCSRACRAECGLPSPRVAVSARTGVGRGRVGEGGRGGGGRCMQQWGKGGGRHVTPPSQSINQSKRKTSNANGQTNLGHKHKAPDHNHEATQPMVDLPHTS